MANKARELIFLVSLFTYLFLVSSSALEADTLAQVRQLKDSDSEHLVSAGGTFRLGFFSPGTSSNRYLGIWYNQPADGRETQITDRKAVWVANRNAPLYDKSGILMIDEVGNLKISRGGSSPFLLSSAQTDGNLSATLLDSGNFILKELSSDGSTKQILWQSFDYPTDTLLPGMKLGINFKTGHNWSLTSWITNEVPATGSFTLGGDPSGASQLIISWQGKSFWISGLWRNRSKHFDLAPKLSHESDHEFSYTKNENESYFSFSVNRNHTVSRYMIASSGEILQRSMEAPFGGCGSSNFESFLFSPSYNHPGCMGKHTKPKCRENSTMVQSKRGKTFPIGKIKFDEYYNLSLYDCGAKCFNDCSCIAFASDNQKASCEIWSEGLSSKSYSLSHKETRQLYLMDNSTDSEGWQVPGFMLFMVPLMILCFAFISILVFLIVKEIMRPKGDEAGVEMLLNELGASGRNKEEGKKKRESQFFSLATIAQATNNFEVTNKLGQGGFGSVYKGKLPNGQEIAVKRLSSNSGQGLVEFRNEAVLIAKLQHRNLVSLEGCCLEKEEKMLIYEYMPNKSLDFLLFDPHPKNVLDWKTRYNIIQGVGQGLLYLHEYSRLRVIHRDLKASNILLDDEMNPKISDFGMARIFGHHDSQANTNRIVGTYGYMSPEYAMDGIYSTKSDIFSFGVLLLEILSGRKNTSFHRLSGPLSLIGYAWELWREDRSLELIDPSLGDSYPNDEVMRCIHVGLLCVQDNPVDRPPILDALSMICSEGNQLAVPKRPAYHYGWNREEGGIVECDSENFSPNKVSVTEMEMNELTLYGQQKRKREDNQLTPCGSIANDISAVGLALMWLFCFEKMMIQMIQLVFTPKELLNEIANGKNELDVEVELEQGHEEKEEEEEEEIKEGFVIVAVVRNAITKRDDLFRRKKVGIKQILVDDKHCLSSFPPCQRKISTQASDTFLSPNFNQLMANKGRELIFLISLFTYLFLVSSSALETDTLAQGRQLKDSDSEYLVSAGGTFRLGFFSPGTSSNRYLGIWYNQQADGRETQITDRKAVWVANRNAPLYDKSGILMIDEVGNLKISHGGGSPFLLSSAQTDGNLSATLLDSGNFILKELSSDGSTKQILWQSFDYPTDTLLPGMKLGINFKTGHNWSLTSWISNEVPATGSFTLGGDPSGASQLIISWQGKSFWISGLWRNRSKHFDLAPKLSYESDHEFSYTKNENESYFSFSVNRNHTMSRYMIASSGEVLERSMEAPFGGCGFSYSESLMFSPSYNRPGCMGQQTMPGCRKDFSMRRFKRSKTFPKDKFKYDEYYNLSLYDCGAKCFRDCSCIAFASDNQTASCEIWSKGLSSKSYSLSHKETRQLYLMDNPTRDEAEVEMLLNELGASGRNKEEGKKKRELQFFSLATIAHATNNFAATNKLGQGGFGSVYKGKLPDGQEIAVKRLSSNSGQGLVEFRNEAVLIAKLQHRNLVSLEGCCLEKEEKMLIYEYMPNKSLDFFLFDPQQKNVLDWKTRYNIIQGVGQGLLYLHEYSRLRVIHRDLKASNILLDDEMNPKISDFGMARIFGHHESEANTNRIVGTYGYMSPEYAMDGIYSTKSDIFSFGVLLLEILSGRKNTSFHRLSGPLSLIGYAWELWREDRSLELIDPSLGDSYPNDEAMRCIHVGLLCVQDNPVDRPAVIDALSMIYSEGNQLAIPKGLAYHYGWNREEAGRVECDLENFSPNEVSITEMEAR
ncbi:uncharacterized protein LOC111274135 [Durio zibethinus]|uniref:non-specific serine/threonine protein kinase n=1 Tax=Durio zibethinus TaxID=66656 RepID=A0A6P5WEQ4_DURZI|nr:uncharacterized protein LOC111274135 [Durio zibethinus]